uniref:Uncharacterized protein n=1 Tax=Oryza rufipogon TaxID=4529 RepID=A0A0E0PQ49_ORYRU
MQCERHVDHPPEAGNVLDDNAGSDRKCFWMMQLCSPLTRLPQRDPSFDLSRTFGDPGSRARTAHTPVRCRRSSRRSAPAPVDTTIAPIRMFGSGSLSSPY